MTLLFFQGLSRFLRHEASLLAGHIRLSRALPHRLRPSQPHPGVGAIYVENCRIKGFAKGIEETTSAATGTQIFGNTPDGAANAVLKVK